ncbi:hypothetical protein B0H12DRAFT_1096681 [Mycena haematopus]|nr:hypothetical protein B0H12DRAFT_1096681 [Mycena haematopus]
MLGSQSVNGLERSIARKGSVMKVVFLSAVLPREGEGVIQVMGTVKFVASQWIEIKIHVSCRSRVRTGFGNAESDLIQATTSSGTFK